MCTNRQTGQPKRRFDTMDAAQREADRLQYRDGVPMNAFKCAVCHKYHVGMKPGGPARHDKHRFVYRG